MTPTISARVLIFFDYFSNDAAQFSRIQAILLAVGARSLRFDFL
jgi:hypothetical protein